MRLSRLKTAAFLSASLAFLLFSACASNDAENVTPAETSGGSAETATDYNAVNASAEAETPATMTDSSSGQPVPGMSDEARQLRMLLDNYARDAEIKMRAGNYADALEVIANGLMLEGTDSRLLRLQREVYATIGRTPTTDERTNVESGRAGEASYVIRERLREAEEHMSNGRFTEAIEAAEAAKDLIRWSNWLVEDDNSLQIANRIVSEAQKLREEQRGIDAREIAETRRRQAEMQAIAELEKFRGEIRADFEEAKRHFDQRNYRDAVLKLNHILYRDPFNEPVIELKQVAQSLQRASEDRAVREEYQNRWNLAMAELDAAMAFPVDTIEWSPYEFWRGVEERSKRVKAASAPNFDKQDMAVRATLESQEVPFNISGSETLAEIFNEFRRISRLNIVIKPGVDLEGTPEQRELGRMPLQSALNLLAKMMEFEWYVANGVLTIAAAGDDDRKGREVTRIFDVSDILINLPHFRASEPRLRVEDTDSRFPTDEQDLDLSEFEIDGEGLVAIIIESIDVDSWAEFGEPEIRAGSGALIVRNTFENVQRVEQLLDDLRISAGLVVNVEARFITIRDDFLQDIGIDFRGVGGAPQGTTPQPVPAALDDVNHGTNNVPTGAGTDNEAGFFMQDINPNQSVNIDVRSRVENLFDQAVGGRRGGFGLTNTGGASFQLSFVDNPEITAVLRAVKKKERAALLTAPSIAVHNTQRGFVSILNEISYIADFEVNVAATSSIADPQVEVIKDGIVLDVRPTISADRRYVTLELRPTLAVLLRPIATINTTLATGPPVSIQTPELQLQRLRTAVTVPDRGSFLIGGLRRLIDTELVSGVPILSDLPLVGWLFTRKAQVQTRQDVIVIVSVEIVDLSELVEREFG